LLVSTPLNQQRGLSGVEGRIKDQSVIVSMYLHQGRSYEGSRATLVRNRQNGDSRPRRVCRS